MRVVSTPPSTPCITFCSRYDLKKPVVLIPQRMQESLTAERVRSGVPFVSQSQQASSSSTTSSDFGGVPTPFELSAPKALALFGSNAASLSAIRRLLLDLVFLRSHGKWSLKSSLGSTSTSTTEPRVAVHSPLAQCLVRLEPPGSLFSRVECYKSQNRLLIVCIYSVYWSTLRVPINPARMMESCVRLHPNPPAQHFEQIALCLTV